MRALTIKTFRSLANWIFHGMYDFVCGVVCQTAARSFLDSKVQKKSRRGWNLDEQ